MTRRAWTAAATLLALLVVVGAFYGPADEQDAGTISSTSRDGYRAFLDLLVALGVPAERHAGPPDLLPAGATAWWIAPPVCGDDRRAWGGYGFVAAGGTAVVLVPRRGAPVACQLDPDIPLPARIALRPGTRAAGGPVVVAGDLVRGLRRLPAEPFQLAFTAAEGWTVRATADGYPLIVERELGRGRLVLVADARLFRNVRLDAGDTAPLVVDLVRDTGAPRFVEGWVATAGDRGALVYLLASPAVAPFIGVVLVGLLLAWHGTLVPPRRLAASGVGAPTLDTFVDALAGLYARTRDWPRVAARYRELTAARLRRHFGLAPETRTAALIARLERDARFRNGVLDPLVAPRRVDDEPGLAVEVAALDALVARVLR